MKLNIQLFAGGTIPRTSAPSNGDIQIVWSSTPSGSAENYSTVTASVQVKRRSSGETTGTFSGYLQIDNESVSVKKKFSPLKNEWKTVGTFTKTINHNQDGTKSIVIGAYLEQTGTSLAGDYEASSTVNLDTINRISPVSTVSSADMNTTITINTNRYASFTHTIRYVFGGASGTIATNVGDSTTWAIPITLANQIPNSVKSVGTIYCDTYNGSTYIGTSSQEIVLSVPSSVVPSVSFTMTKGGNTSLNAWVQNKSQAIINITASGSYGSSITSYSINGDGYTYNVNPTTTNTLRATGNQTFYVTVTDSRGRTATTTQTIYVEPYSMPTISTAQVQRCNQDGTLNDNGDYCYYVFNGSISSVNSLNKTNTTYKIGYKLSTDANYTYITIDSNKDSITSSGVLSSGGTEIQFNSSNTYDIQFTIEDTYSTSANTIQLTSGFDLMNFNASGKSMAVGMVSQRTANEECLDIALDTYFNENVITKGTDINLGAIPNTDDSGDIVFRYGDDSEKARIWTDNTYSVGAGPQYRVYDANGNQLYSGRLGLENDYTATIERIVGVWKGLPLYRKIYEGYLNSNGTLDNDISVDGAIQRIEGYVYSIYANWWVIGSHYFPEPRYDSCFTISQSSASFNIETNGYFNQNSKYVVIVEYTK